MVRYSASVDRPLCEQCRSSAPAQEHDPDAVGRIEPQYGTITS